jgi:uncharacterized membrane protein YesL
MINAFRPFGTALRDLFDDFLLFIMCNLTWALLAIPLYGFALSVAVAGQPVLASIVALLGVVPAGPATGALYDVAFRVTDGRAVKYRDFLAAMRKQARIGVLLTAIATVGLLIVLLNLGFYLSVNNVFGGVMLGFWLYLLVFWCGICLYSFPLAFLQEQPDLRTIARNALLMTIGRPIFTALTMLLMAIVIVLSFIIVAPLALFTSALLAVWATRATRTLIDDARRRREAAALKSASVVASEERGRRGQVRPK